MPLATALVPASRRALTVAETADLSVAEGYNLGLHIAAVFIILVASLFGIFLPVAISRCKGKRAVALTILAFKGFGAGVIVCTGFVHMLGDAADKLESMADST